MSHKVEWSEVKDLLVRLYNESLISPEEMEIINQVDPANWQKDLSEWEFIYIFDPYEGGAVIISRFQKTILSLTFEEGVVNYFSVSVRTKQGEEFCGFERQLGTGSWLFSTDMNYEAFPSLMINSKDETFYDEISIKEGLFRLLALCKAIGYLPN